MTNLNIKITVTSIPLVENKGVSVKTGTPKPYHMRSQIAYAHVILQDGTVVDFPEKFEISLEEGQAPYPKGEYTLHPSSVFVKADPYGRPSLQMGRPRLVAVPSASVRS